MGKLTRSKQKTRLLNSTHFLNKITANIRFFLNFSMFCLYVDLSKWKSTHIEEIFEKKNFINKETDELVSAGREGKGRASQPSASSQTKQDTQLFPYPIKREARHPFARARLDATLLPSLRTSSALTLNAITTFFGASRIFCRLSIRQISVKWQK